MLSTGPSMELDLRFTLTPSCCPLPSLDTPGTHLFLWLLTAICAAEVEIYSAASSTSAQTQAASSPVPVCFYAHALLHPCLCCNPASACPPDLECNA